MLSEGSLGFAPGDLFRRQDLFRSQSRLYSLGYYNMVGFDPHVKEENKIDVDVKVQERFTGQISIGAGYSQLTGLSFFLSLRKGNFLWEQEIQQEFHLQLVQLTEIMRFPTYHRWAFINL
ncbi:MAG: POTRA domain-containing protein [Persephonella sp.]|nr:POTRA domain-containing protein [Persephonella sp.]